MLANVSSRTAASAPAAHSAATTSSATAAAASGSDAAEARNAQQTQQTQQAQRARPTAAQRATAQAQRTLQRPREPRAQPQAERPAPESVSARQAAHIDRLLQRGRADEAFSLLHAKVAVLRERIASKQIVQAPSRLYARDDDTGTYVPRRSELGANAKKTQRARTEQAPRRPAEPVTPAARATHDLRLVWVPDEHTAKRRPYYAKHLQDSVDLTEPDAVAGLDLASLRAPPPRAASATPPPVASQRARAHAARKLTSSGVFDPSSPEANEPPRSLTGRPPRAENPQFRSSADAFSWTS